MNTPQNIKNVKSIVREPSTVMASPGQIPPRRRKVSSTSSSQEVSCICLPSFVFFHCLPIFKILSLFAHLSNWFPGRDILSAAKLEQRSSSFFVSSNLSTSSDQRALQVHQPHHCRQDEHWSLIMSKKRLVIKQMETCMKMKHDENCGNQLVVTVFNQRSIGASTLTLAQVSIKMTLFPAPGALTVECLQNCGSQKRFTGLPSLRSPP